jgi:dihydrolipoamide dehydrogenase
MKRQGELVSFMRQGVQGLFRKNRITLINGRGRVAGTGKVEAGGEAFSAGKIILAAGAEWVKPALPGGDLPEVRW